MVIRICLASTEYTVIAEIALKLKWEVTYEYDSEADVYWQDGHVFPEDLSRLRCFQRINHFPGMLSISRKDNLGRSLKKMRNLFPSAYNFFPSTWVLPQDLKELKNYVNPKRARTLIVKPEASSQGRGIFLTRNIEDIPENCVVQRYLHRPFLLDGLKFDLRVYVLVTACEPLRIFVHRDGLVRFATQKYVSPVPSNLEDVYMHLTNYAINKNNPEYNEKHKRSLREFFDEIKDNGGDILWERICDMAVKTICLSQPVVSHMYRASQPYDLSNQICFQLIGLDIFVDDKLMPYVLEVNHTPSFATETPLDLKVKQAVIYDTLKLLGLKRNNRNVYYNEYNDKMLDRATKKGSAMKQYRAEVRAQALAKRIEVEEKFMGGYIRVYPSISKNYEDYLRAATSLWQGDVGYKPPKTTEQQKKPLSRKIESRASNRPVENKLPAIQGKFVAPRTFSFRGRTLDRNS